MSDENLVFLTGRLGKNPEGDGQDNKPIVLSLGQNEKWKDKESGEAKEKTRWFTVKAFGPTGEYCRNNLQKGDLVSVRGRLDKYSWTDDDGSNKSILDIVANSVNRLARPAAASEVPF